MINVSKPCLLALLSGISGFVFAQVKGPSVIASAGGISKTANLILEWTVGEPAVETLSSSSSLYTQGFHQPVLEVQKLSTGRELASLKNKLLVYPNPATSVINIQLDKPAESPLLVSVLDMNGKVLATNNFPVSSTLLRINVSRLAQGAYLLRITDTRGTIQDDYKIIKVQ